MIESIRGRAETEDDVKFLVSHMKRYHMRLADFAQARLLQGLGRGLLTSYISVFTDEK